MKTIGWGIIGCGNVTEVKSGPGFQKAHNSSLVAVMRRTGHLAADYARRHGIPKWYDDAHALINDPNVDAVYVATPHTLHYQNTVEAIRARKHVLCEKPFTVGVREARNLFHMAEQSSVFVMEAMWTYFLPAIQKAREWVEQGRIGRLRQVKADFGYPLLPFDPARREYNAELAGGCLLEMGIYPVALAWLFMQRDPVDIKVTAHKAPNGVEDDVAMLFQYGDESDGAVATLGTSFRSKLQNWAYVIGEEGYIAIPDFWRASECSLYQLDTRVDHFDDGRKSLGFNYETVAANEDIIAGRQQNSLVSWANTIRFQEHMESVKERF